ncbi:hypothetical protein [Haloarcula salina]|uniref:Uncharacterized protein n=1 Tax=Haloarcula salina TaxID=1429914 RepID=A0AA41G0F2_9EURY|nr:hypothetical protein [Haloarcula salina]MBV0901993.1 hypothetical protein [Haloarcula salina]
MSPFVDPATGDLNVAQILSESRPLAKLIGAFVAVALVPYALVYLALGSSPLGAVLALLGQFVLAVGTGIVLMYVVARGRHLADS